MPKDVKCQIHVPMLTLIMSAQQHVQSTARKMKCYVTEDMIIKMAVQWKTFAFLPKTEIAQSSVQSRVVQWSKSAQGKSMPKDVLNLISAYPMTITTLTEISVQCIAARRNRYVLEVMACQITVCQSTPNHLVPNFVQHTVQTMK